MKSMAKFFYCVKCIEKFESDNEVCSRKGVKASKFSELRSLNNFCDPTESNENNDMNKNFS